MGITRHPVQGQRGQHGITHALGQGHQQQKAPQRLAHHPGDQGQRVADDRHPTEQQRPMPPALVMAAGLVQLPGVDRKPAPRLEVLHPAPQPPVDQRAEHVAQGRNAQQQPQAVMPAEQQADQHRFRLQGQEGGGAEMPRRTAQVTRSIDQCAGYSATTTSLPSRVRPMT